MAERLADISRTQEKLTGPQLDVVLRELESLPVCPDILGKVLDLTADALPGPEDPTAARPVPPELTELIACDASLSAGVLRLAAQASPEPARTLAEALGRVGPSAVRRLALTCPPPPAPGDDEDVLDFPSLGRHSLAVALAAEGIARRLPDAAADPDEARLAGLLHDVGRLALAACFPKTYARVLRTPRSPEESLSQIEGRILGIDHAIAGRRLAELWRFPPAVTQAAWLHPQPFETLPEDLAHRTTVLIVMLACEIARGRNLGFAGARPVPGRQEALADRLRLPAQALRDVIDSLADPLRSAERTLAPDDPDAQRRREQALAGAARELARDNERLQARAAGLARKAQAFHELRGLAQSLRVGAAVVEVLPLVARTLATARGLSATPARPVVAYSLEESGEILALRWTGGNPLTCRRDASLPETAASRPAPASAPAEQALAQELGEGRRWNDWFDACDYRHQPLLCGGRWVGGVLFPAAPPSPGEDVFEGLAAAMGLALALVQGRSAALRLGEQLAQASQTLAQTQEALAEARTLSAIGEMAAGAAHELNNPLAIISGRAQLMARKAAGPEDRKVWQLVMEQAQRVSDIVTELMEFARPPAPAPRPVPAEELLSAAAKAFAASAHPKAAAAKVDVAVPPGAAGLPPVLADPEQVRSVLAELLANAASASGDAPAIHLAAEVDESRRTVLLSVRDEGTGMDADTLARAFTPFFSAQPAGRRRGMGLSRARRIIEAHRGRIWLRSAPHEGTTVFIELPAAPAAAKEEGHARS